MLYGYMGKADSALKKSDGDAAHGFHCINFSYYYSIALWMGIHVNGMLLESVCLKVKREGKNTIRLTETLL